MTIADAIIRHAKLLALVAICRLGNIRIIWVQPLCGAAALSSAALFGWQLGGRAGFGLGEASCVAPRVPSLVAERPSRDIASEETVGKRLKVSKRGHAK
jgi:hypothetical protein